MNHENEEFEEMDMPTPCQKCNNIFDLNDGYGSEKWFPNTVICESCYKEEEKEIELDERLDELYSQKEDAEWTINDVDKQLTELKMPLKRPRIL